MKATWIMAAREVREKARLFVVCAALALVPFAATLLPSTRANAAATIALVGGFLATVLGVGIAVTLGASTIARDLAERRMSFYFTKPVGAAAIWVGKAAAGLFLSLSCAAIIATPAVLASPKQWAMYWLGDVQPLAVLAVAIVVSFFLAHVLSTVIRSRSPLLALDFLFLIVAAAALYLMHVPLLLGSAMVLIGWLETAVGVGLLLVLAAAPVWQLANGRSDIRRSHAALMRFLWPAVAVLLLLAGGFVAWVVHVGPDDVAVSYVEQPRRGTNVVVMGTARNRFDYHAAFLVDRATGTFKRIPAPVWSGAQFSEDGRVAVWMHGRELETTSGRTGIVVSPAASFALSDDGQRVAVSNGNLLSVYEVATGKILASAAGLDGRSRHQLFFVTNDLVRVYEHAHLLGVARPLRIIELDVRARQTRRTGERNVIAPRQAVSASGDGSRIFIRGENVIADGRTGVTVARIGAGNLTHSAMLHDGRVAAITLDAGQAPHLRTFDRDGTPRLAIAFPKVRSLWIAAETEDGKLILAAYGRTMIVVDLATGVVERTLPGIRGPLPRWSMDPRLARFAADQELTGVDANGRLVVWKHEGRTEARPLLQSR